MFELSDREREELGLEFGFPAYHSRKLQLWEADHTHPVVEGGGVVLGDASVAGVDAFTTLCVSCHRKKTAGEAALRALRVCY